MDERELYHAGIKGMKWGVRRYQNKDGSLTPAGRIRYGASKAGDSIRSAMEKAGEKYTARRAAKKEEKRVAALMKKPIRKLTEAELKERTDRVNKEKQLRDAEKNNRTAANEAEAFIKRFGSKFLNDALVPAAINAGKDVATNMFKKTLSSTLGLDAKDLTNSYDLFKKAKFDVSKLTDEEIYKLEKRTKAEKTIYQETSNVERQKKNRNNQNQQQNQQQNQGNNNQNQQQNQGNNQTHAPVPTLNATPIKYVNKNGTPPWLKKKKP